MDKKPADKDWARQFLQRFPELSPRRPKATSLARQSGFNRVQVGRFFELLNGEFKSHAFSPDHIYNADESGITMMEAPGKILTKEDLNRWGG